MDLIIFFNRLLGYFFRLNLVFIILDEKRKKFCSQTKNITFFFINIKNIFKNIIVNKEKKIVFYDIQARE